jgi:tRNA pseudouridine55 synthase
VNKFNFSKESYWLNIDKPSGISSAKVVAIVKRLSKAKKVGHAGTLDPLACGILPIAVNNATRTAEYITNDEKEYFVTIKWGEFRNTDDLEGEIQCQNDFIPTKSSILSALSSFCGEVSQTPSKFSAIKINGIRSYKIAHRDDYEIPRRQIFIKKIFFIESKNCFSSFVITCGKGTYIRSFVRDLATKLGAYGFMFYLKRNRVGEFKKNDTISLDKLKSIISVADHIGRVISIDSAVSSLDSVFLTEDEHKKLNQGQVIAFSNSRFDNKFVSVIGNSAKEGALKLKFQDILFGIGDFSEGLIKPKKIFN